MTASWPVDATLKEAIEKFTSDFDELPDLVSQEYALLQLLIGLQKALPPERFHELMVWLNGRAEVWLLSGIWLSPDPY